MKQRERVDRERGDNEIKGWWRDICVGREIYR
jgi:hypothetical protein